MRPLQIWPSLLLAALVCGCAAASLDDNEKSFERARQARGNCSLIASRGTAQPPACVSGDQALLEIARRAHAAKDSASDDRNNIATLRLAAQAGWESRTPEGLEIADAASADGVRRCDSIPGKQFGAPRDCALLRVTPGIVAHVRALILAARLSQTDAARFSEQDRADLARVSDAYIANTFDFTERVRTTRLASDTELDASVIGLLDEYRLAFFCTAQTLAQLNKAARDTKRMMALFSESGRIRKVDRRVTPSRCTRAA